MVNALCLLWKNLRWCYFYNDNVILVVSKRNVTWSQSFFNRRGLTIVTVSQYLRGLIRETENQDTWLRERVWDWTDIITTMARFVRQHLQSPHAGLKNSLQQQWYFVQRATQVLREDFDLVEISLQEELILAIFHEVEATILGQTITRLPVKHAGLAIPEPTHID